MRKLVAAGVVAALLASGAGSVAAAHARAVPTHVITRDYTHPDGVRAANHYTEVPSLLPDLNNFEFDPKPGDHSLTVIVHDVAGPTTETHVVQPAATPNGKPLDILFCTPTLENIPLVSTKPVHIAVYAGVCIGHETSYATQGSITAKFYKAHAESLSMGMHMHHPGS
ncbi:MAG: hypothetical protein M3290_06180 [Actinomycetota bacterium]|nr:hypothetical protein [Actinomycetota bacterium]